MDLYSITVPTLQHGLACLKSIVQKAGKHAESCGYEPDNLLSLRFFPDMFALPKTDSDCLRSGDPRRRPFVGPTTTFLCRR